MSADNGGEPTLWEVYRLQKTLQKSVDDLASEVRDRHHRLANDVNKIAAPMSALGVRMNVAETQIEHLGTRMGTVETRSATIAGAIGALSFLTQLVPWPWKR